MDLDLSRNKIDDVGAEALCLGLSRNLGLKKLDLSGNFIKERGGRAFANCLKINHTLEELNLKENNINDLAGQHLDDICRKNRNITDINLDLNSVALSFVFNIKHNLKKNKDQKKKKVVPELKGKIMYLSQNSEKLGKVNNDLEKRQSEFSELFKRVEKNSERLSVIRQEENVKNDVVHKDYLAVKEKNEKISKEFEEMLYENTVNYR
jgi:septal ring factor EnvC (AmiA/AmiB activator)